MLSLFTKHPNEPVEMPRETYEQTRLLIEQYRAAKREFDSACEAVRLYANRHFDTRFVFYSNGVTVATNTLTNPANRGRMRLEAVRESTRQQFMQLLWQRSELLKKLGEFAWRLYGRACENHSRHRFF